MAKGRATSWASDFSMVHFPHQPTKGIAMPIKIDHGTIPRSYRDYLDLMVREGEFFEINAEKGLNNDEERERH
jgi:hypothetical protein